MNIALLGTDAAGNRWLAEELARHCPRAFITDHPPLMKAASSDAALQALTQTHRQHYDLTLLTGTGLAEPGRHLAGSARHETVDAWLRAALQQAGIAFGVLHGSRLQRLSQALRLIVPQSQPSPRWTGVCEKCADPDCEFRIFTALQRSKAAAHQAP